MSPSFEQSPDFVIPEACVNCFTLRRLSRGMATIRNLRYLNQINAARHMGEENFNELWAEVKAAAAKDGRDMEGIYRSMLATSRMMVTSCVGAVQLDTLPDENVTSYSCTVQALDPN